jgi:hypothetical protein
LTSFCCTDSNGVAVSSSSSSASNSSSSSSSSSSGGVVTKESKDFNVDAVQSAMEIQLHVKDITEPFEKEPESWKTLWKTLKSIGWKWKPGKMTAYRYLRPNASIKTGTVGVDYFDRTNQVVEFVLRYASNKQRKKASRVIEQEAQAEYEEDEEDDEDDEEEEEDAKEEEDIFDKVLEVATHNLSGYEGGYTHKELQNEFRMVYKDMVLQKRLLNKSQEHKRIMKTVEELRERHEDFSYEEALDEAVRLRRRMLDDMVPEPDDLEAVEDLDDVERVY